MAQDLVTLTKFGRETYSSLSFGNASQAEKAELAIAITYSADDNGDGYIDEGEASQVTNNLKNVIQTCKLDLNRPFVEWKNKQVAGTSCLRLTTSLVSESDKKMKREFPALLSSDGVLGDSRLTSQEMTLLDVSPGMINNNDDDGTLDLQKLYDLLKPSKSLSKKTTELNRELAIVGKALAFLESIRDDIQKITGTDDDATAHQRIAETAAVYIQKEFGIPCHAMKNDGSYPSKGNEWLVVIEPKYGHFKKWLNRMAAVLATQGEKLALSTNQLKGAWPYLNPDPKNPLKKSSSVLGLLGALYMLDQHLIISWESIFRGKLTADVAHEINHAIVAKTCWAARKHQSAPAADIKALKTFLPSEFIQTGPFNEDPLPWVWFEFITANDVALAVPGMKARDKDDPEKFIRTHYTATPASQHLGDECNAPRIQTHAYAKAMEDAYRAFVLTGNREYGDIAYRAAIQSNFQARMSRSVAVVDSMILTQFKTVEADRLKIVDYGKTVLGPDTDELGNMSVEIETENGVGRMYFFKEQLDQTIPVLQAVQNLITSQLARFDSIQVEAAPYIKRGGDIRLNLRPRLQ